MAWHDQQRSPFGDLQDEVVAPGGVFRGARARVYWLFRLAAERRHRFRVGAARELGPEGFVPMYIVREPWAGGDEGGRRLRELRGEYGLTFRVETFAENQTRLYLLERDPLGPLNGGGSRARARATAAAASKPDPSAAPTYALDLTFSFGPDGEDLAEDELLGYKGCASPEDYRRRLIVAYRNGQIRRFAGTLCFQAAPPYADVLRAAVTWLGAVES